MTWRLRPRPKEGESQMANRQDSRRRIVFSTAHGRMCPQCDRPSGQCVCRQKRATVKGDGVVRIGRQTKGRKGKGVTLITGIPLVDPELKTLARNLKAKCGSGGAVKDGVIEIQGDHRTLLVQELKKHGWTVKLAGG